MLKVKLQFALTYYWIKLCENIRRFKVLHKLFRLNSFIRLLIVLHNPDSFMIDQLIFFLSDRENAEVTRDGHRKLHSGAAGAAGDGP